jgi:hypothetical protein
MAVVSERQNGKGPLDASTQATAGCRWAVVDRRIPIGPLLGVVIVVFIVIIAALGALVVVRVRGPPPGMKS